MDISTKHVNAVMAACCIPAPQARWHCSMPIPSMLRSILSGWSVEYAWRYAKRIFCGFNPARRDGGHLSIPTCFKSN